MFENAHVMVWVDVCYVGSNVCDTYKLEVQRKHSCSYNFVNKRLMFLSCKSRTILFHINTKAPRFKSHVPIFFFSLIKSACRWIIESSFKIVIKFQTLYYTFFIYMINKLIYAKYKTVHIFILVSTCSYAWLWHV